MPTCMNMLCIFQKWPVVLKLNWRYESDLSRWASITSPVLDGWLAIFPEYSKTNEVTIADYVIFFGWHPIFLKTTPQLSISLFVCFTFSLHLSPSASFVFGWRACLLEGVYDSQKSRTVFLALIHPLPWCFLWGIWKPMKHISSSSIIKHHLTGASRTFTERGGGVWE